MPKKGLKFLKRLELKMAGSNIRNSHESCPRQEPSLLVGLYWSCIILFKLYINIQISRIY